MGATRLFYVRKIEELTLYMIKQDKKSQSLQLRVKQLEEKLKRK